MDFAELIEMLRNPGEDGIPETIYDDLANTYNHALETRDAKISEIEEINRERESEISRLKSMNYDLMMASAVNEDDGESGGDEDNSADDDEPSGIDDLFEN